MTKANRKFSEELMNLAEAEIDAMDSSDLLNYFNADGYSSIPEIAECRESINSALISHKKNKLNIAREAMAQDDGSFDLNEVQIADAKQTIINLIISNRLPSNLTIAFRDGEALSDEEALSILRDLKVLGIDLTDESK